LTGRTHDLVKYINMKKTFTGKLIAVFALILFFLNSHFLIFLKIKVNHEAFPEITKKHFNSSFIDKNEYSIRKNVSHIAILMSMYDRMKCAPEFGTWYSKFMDNTWFWVDIIVYFLIPFITMCITFSIIKFKLKAINRNYACILLDKGYNNYNKRIYSRKIRRNNKIIYVLFGTNLYFCISIVPLSIFSIFKEANFNLSVKESYHLKSFVDVLFYSNNALSIVFYGFTSKDFRRTLKRMLGLECCFAKKNSSNTISRRNKWSISCKKNI